MNNGRFEVGFDIDYDVITPSEPQMDRYPNNIDQRGRMKDVKFLWNRWITEITHCDTVHLLYLLQIACDLHRQWVIERNQYFASILRTDRFIDHVDGPQLITNLLKWHIEDKQQNQWNGSLVQCDMTLLHDRLVHIGTSTFTFINLR